VISIGNVTMVGSGKTPMALYLAERLSNLQSSRAATGDNPQAI
jgi:tetraacyldisaccharide-1-P 4'-kinase